VAKKTGHGRRRNKIAEAKIPTPAPIPDFTRKFAMQTSVFSDNMSSDDFGFGVEMLEEAMDG